MCPRAWPFFVGGVICLVNSVSVCERKEREEARRREKMREREKKRENEKEKK